MPTHRSARQLLTLLTLIATACTNDGSEVERQAVTEDTWKSINYPSTTDTTPEPVSFNGKLYVFARGIGDSKIYVSSSPDGTIPSWNGWTAVGTKLTSVAVTPVAFKGTLYLFAVTQITNVVAVNKTTDGSTWSGWSAPFVASSNQPVSATVFLGGLYVAVKGVGDNGIYVISSANGTSWSNWSSSLGTTDVSPRIGTTPNGTNLVLLAKGIADSRVNMAFSANGTSWSGWAALGFGTMSRAPRIATFGNDTYVVSSGQGDSRVHATASRDMLQWSDWFELPSFVTAGGDLALGLQTAQPVGVAPFKTGLYWFAQKLSDNHTFEEAMPAYHLPFNTANWGLTKGNWDDPVGPSYPHAAGDTSDQAYAFDFKHSFDGDVVAMRDGTVIMYRQFGYNPDAGVGGPPAPAPTCDGTVAFVWVRHDDGSVAEYCHLEPNSVVVGCNARVPAGTRLGQAGYTNANEVSSQFQVDVRQYATVNPAEHYAPNDCGTDAFNKGPTMPIHFVGVGHTTTPWRPTVGEKVDP